MINCPNTASEGGLALAGVRVLDLTQFLAGPWATQILADLGADVIKVEAPEGDLTRRLPPHFIGDDSVYYLSTNRSKRSIVIDLKTVKGKAILQRLARRCDVIIENFRPGVAVRLGLDSTVLTKERPELIWASISGFGQDGPASNLPAYDMIVQALSGGMSMTGEKDGPPVRAGIPIADLSAGLYAVIGILAALHRRERERIGDVIDISMLDCQLAMTCYQSAYYLNSGVIAGPQGREHDSITTYRSFTCGDGRDVVVTANTERMWQSLCDVLDMTELAADPRFADSHCRYENSAALLPILDKGFRRQTAAYWDAALKKAGIPAGLVKNIAEALEDEQVTARNLVIEMSNRNGDKVSVVGNPIRSTNAERGLERYPPALGEDNGAILSELLGVDHAEVRTLYADGVVSARESKISLGGAMA